jgi:hypothetical protein
VGPPSSCLKRVHSDEASELDSSASEECSSSGNAAESDTGFEPGPSAAWIIAFTDAAKAREAAAIDAATEAGLQVKVRHQFYHFFSIY